MFKSKRLRWTLISVLIITPLGFYSKFYNGQAARWVNDSLGGVLYVIFWCLFAFLFLSDTKPWKIATIVFAITCSLEFLQLWHLPFLEFLRSYFLGRTLLGTSFTWSDFPYYLVGCGIGWLWMKSLQKRSR
ncbi:MAG: DUF2809 domain-containing protein [Candidatus Aminicenantes bacterium]|nr:DUF2809 domain-containing protein [Candidatus Aminicenantes bacterium]